MCDECHQNPHATMCPNNPALADDDPIMKRCPICEREFPEEDMTWAVCEKCLDIATVGAVVFKYAKHRMVNVPINSLALELFSADEINQIIEAIVRVRMHDSSDSERVMQAIERFASEDRGDFADWLKAQKNID